MKGRFDAAEDAYIRNNHATTTDAQMASALGRTKNSVASRRRLLGLKGNRRKPRTRAYPGQQQDAAARAFWEAECRKTPNFRGIVRTLDKNEESAYVEMWTEWFSEGFDFTSMERNLIHYAIMAQIRVHRLVQEEKDSRDRALAEWQKGNPLAMPVSRTREKKEQFDIITKNHESLAVQRRQRLGGKAEANQTFIDIIKASKAPGSALPVLECVKARREG